MKRMIPLMLVLLTLAASVRAADPAPLRVVCLGDSITGHRPHEPYLDKYLKWTDLLGLMLEARTGRPVTVLNRGFAGDKTYTDPGPQTPGGAARVQKDLLDEKPDLAVILIGGNDKKDTAEARERTRKNLNHIVQGCRDAGIKVLLLEYAVLGPGSAAGHPVTQPNTPPVQPTTQPDKTWYHLTANNDLIGQVAKEREVPVLRLQPAFDAALKVHSRKELVNEVDGVHLAPAGEMTVARAVFAKLVELGWASPAGGASGTGVPATGSSR